MRRVIALILTAIALTACDHLDINRIPPAAVYVPFYTIGDWNIYGVSGAGQFRYFIKQDRTPAGYQYSAVSQTGFGGVLLISDIHGNPVAYDLACPVECKSNIRISVIPDRLIAECPVCHSTYDIVTNYCQPLSGVAAQKGYGLRRYVVAAGSSEYMMISGY